MSFIIENRFNIFILIVFIVLNIVISFFSVEGATFSEGADASQYFKPALNIVNNGGFSESDELFTKGVPLYSIFLSILFKFIGFNNSEIAIVFCQTLMLYLTGYMSKLLFLQVFKGRNKGYLVQCLVIFNPNSIITAHLVQSETLFTLLLVCALYYLLDYVKRNKKKSALYGGVFVGLLSLTRPAGIYIAFFMPFILLIAYFIKARVCNVKISLVDVKKYSSGLLFFIVLSQLIVSPWYVRNYINTGELFLSSNSGYYLKDQYIQLLSVGNKWSEEKSIDYINSLKEEYHDKNQFPNLCLNNERHWTCKKYLFNLSLVGILDQPIINQIDAFLQSWTYLYFTGGASNYRNYFGLSGKDKIIALQKDGGKTLKKIYNFLGNNNLPYLLILAVTTAFAFITRIMGFVGMYYAYKDKNLRPYFFIIMSVIVLFTAMYIYLGQSRFRVPLEPFLMMLTSFGVYNFILKFSKKNEEN